MLFTIELNIVLVKKVVFFSQYYAKIKIDSYDSLPIKKILAL